MQFSKLDAICKEKKTSVSALLVKMGMSKGNIRNWKKGVQPKYHVVQNMAALLGIKVEDLLSDEEIQKENHQRETIDHAIESATRVVFSNHEPQNDLAKMLQSAPGLMFNGEPLSDEDREKVLKAIKFAMDLGDKK